MGLKIRTRWSGTYVPGLTGWCQGARFHGQLPIPERWAVYVVELPHRGLRPDWLVVGRLLQRPWSRVGGHQVFASLGLAREAAERMIQSIAPWDATVAHSPKK